jgi:citrate lyase beta subunit
MCAAKFALREAHLKDEHKTTWWPARRISAKNEEYWLDDLDLVIEELDNDGGVSLYMLFDEQNSLVAVILRLGRSERRKGDRDYVF